MSAVDDYLKTVTRPQKRELERLRKIILRLVPEAEETISYGMPAFRYKNKSLIYFGAFKNHMSIFPTSAPLTAVKDKLGGFTVSKGTIQFTEHNPLPESVIKELLFERINNILKL